MSDRCWRRSRKEENKRKKEKAKEREREDRIIETEKSCLVTVQESLFLQH